MTTALVGFAAVTAAMGYALSKIGDKYVYGAKGPTTFDCSGLTTDAWAAAGYDIGAGTSGQLATGDFIVTPGTNALWSHSVWELLRGDLLFPGSEHVQLYDGEGWVVEAPAPGLLVRRVPQWTPTLYAVRRPNYNPVSAPLLWPGLLLRVGVTYYGTGKWQHQMNELLPGVNLTEDSSYGTLTAAATGRFQHSRNLPQTKMVDKTTWTAAFA